MKPRLQLAATAAVLALATSLAPAPAPGDSIELAWRLPAGARYQIATAVEQSSTTTVMDQEQTESMEQRRTNTLRVLEVDGRGKMTLAMKTDSLYMRKSSQALTLTLSAKRDAEGVVKTDISVESKVPAFEVEAFESFFESVGTNMLELEYRFELDPYGKVLTASVSGDPFANLPQSGRATAMAKQAMEMMISTDELADAAAAEMFVQLPKGFVKVADSWDVTRELNSLGVQMIGSGRGSLNEVQGEGAERVAVIKESMDYAILTDGLEAKLADLMNLVYQQAGIDVRVELDLRAERIKASSTTQFDLAAGCCTNIRWDAMRIPMNGTMKAAGQAVEMGMVVEMKNASATWIRLRDE